MTTGKPFALSSLIIDAIEADSESSSGLRMQDAARAVRFIWRDIPTWDQDSIRWVAPSSFVLYSDGSFAMAIGRLANNYDSYGPFDRHFSIRFLWTVTYSNAQGAPIHRFDLNCGEMGYQGSQDNVVLNGVDGSYLQWRDQITDASAERRRESFY